MHIQRQYFYIAFCIGNSFSCVSEAKPQTVAGQVSLQGPITKSTARTPNPSAPSNIFIDELEESCMLKDALPIDSINSVPKFEGEVQIVFKSPQGSRLLTKTVARETAERIKLKKGTKLCWFRDDE